MDFPHLAIGPAFLIRVMVLYGGRTSLEGASRHQTF